jgi:hypothetical protein
MANINAPGMNRPTLLFASCALLACSLPTSALEQLNSSSQNSEQIEDLGEIVEADSSWRDKVRTNLSLRGEYTTNAKLSGDHSSSDFIFLPTLDIGFTQAINSKLSFDMAGKIELGLYSDHHEREFIGYSLKSTLDYHPKEAWPRLYAAVEPYRYDSLDSSDMLTEAVGLTMGTSWGRAFNSGHSLFFAGYAFTHYIADPSIDTRNAHRITAGITHQLRSNLTAQLVYAWQYSDFTDFDRRDSKHILGLNIIYQINQSWFTTVSGTFVDNDSDAENSSYQSAGGAVGVTYQF